MKPQTTILSLEDIQKRLDSFIKYNEVGTIFPENFFTSVKHHLEDQYDKGYSSGRIETLMKMETKNV